MNRTLNKTILIALWLVGLCMLLLLWPTNDDWGYLTAPYLKGDWLHRMMPNGVYWRPFDALFGTFLNQNIGMFPSLNHIANYFGHCGGGILVWLICNRLNYGRLAKWISVSYFLFLPAMLGALLGCDSMNQTYSSTWGLLALYVFLFVEGRRKYLWLLFALFATFSKENGLAWFVVPPLFAYGLNRADKKRAGKQAGYGILSVAVYFIFRILLTTSNSAISTALNDEGSAYAFSIKRKIVDVCSFVISTFTTIDPIAIVPAITRNYVIAALSILASLPFLYILLRGTAVCAKDSRRFLTVTCLCIVITVLPHLATHFGPMHAYAGLGLTALLIGWIIQKSCIAEKTIKIAFGVFLVAAMLVDAHHYYWMLKSSRLFIPMSQNTIKVLGGSRPQKMFFVSRHTFKRYSAFVIPHEEEFMYGAALKFYNRYDWPLETGGVTIEHPTKELLDKIVREKSGLYDAIIYMDGADATLLYQKR